MADPAMEAASRVWATQKNIPFNAESPWARDSLIPAAREALAPIRELHAAFLDHYKNRDDLFAHGVLYAMGDLAKLIYPESEL
jgi:hypothetical protein